MKETTTVALFGVGSTIEVSGGCAGIVPDDSQNPAD